MINEDGNIQLYHTYHRPGRDRVRQVDAIKPIEYIKLIYFLNYDYTVIRVNLTYIYINK